MVTRLGLHGGPRSLYGDFAGKAASAVQMSGSTGWGTAPTGDLFAAASLSGNTDWDTALTGSLDVEAALSGGAGVNWLPSGDLASSSAIVEDTATGGITRKSRRRYLVEIDGQFFDADSVFAVEAVLKQAEEVAKKSAQIDIVNTSHKIRIKPPRVIVKTASGNKPTSAIIAQQVASTQRAINKIYRHAHQEVQQIREIADLMHKKIEKEDEETILMLIL